MIPVLDYRRPARSLCVTTMWYRCDTENLLVQPRPQGRGPKLMKPGFHHTLT